MSNIGLFSTASLVATDLSVNGTISSSGKINLIASNLLNYYKQTNNINGVLTTTTNIQLNNTYAYFYGYTGGYSYPVSLTVSSGYVLAYNTSTPGLRIGVVSSAYAVFLDRTALLPPRWIVFITLQGSCALVETRQEINGL